MANPLILDIVNKIALAQEIQSKRPNKRDNPEGGHSTHLMSQADNNIFPMLFELFGQWNEYDEDKWRDAYKYARQQGEVWEFDNQEEASKWAEGRWKQKNIVPYINSLIEKNFK